MRVRANLIDFKSIKTELTKIVKQEEEVIKDKIKQIAIRELEKTLKYRGKTREDGFKDAYVSVLFNSKNKSLNVKIAIKDRKTNDFHIIWHMIEGGTKKRRIKKTVRFRQRKENRTRPNVIEAKPFAGYDGWTTLKKGKIISGIEGRNWYKITLNTLEMEIQKDLNFYEIIRREVG